MTSMSSAVGRTLDELELAPADAGAAELARKLAESIDIASGDPKVLSDLSPKLLAVLESLGATPKARAQNGKEAAPNAAKGKLAVLREAAG